MTTFREAMQVKEKVCKKLLLRKDIIGIGVGLCQPNLSSHGAGLVIYTNKKYKKCSIPKSVSAKIEGKRCLIPIRVVKTNAFVANAVQATSSQYRKKVRPVPPGYSVGYSGASGTAGLIVINSPGRNQLYICSNNHVLNKDNTPGFTETIQPGGADGGRASSDTIGRLDRFVKLQKNSDNYLDAATSLPLRNSLLNPRYPTVGTVPGHYENYRTGWRVYKVGRTTGAVRGTIQSINTDLKVGYGSYGGLGTILFKNQTIITSNQAVSLPGDSGSVWLHNGNKYAISVNYAGTADGKLSVSYPIHWFMQVFKTRVARPNGQAGLIRRVSIRNRRLQAAFTRPLSSSQLNRIKVLKSFIRKLKKA